MNIATLDWAPLQSFIDDGLPFAKQMGGSKDAQLGYVPARSRLSLRLPLALTEVVDVQAFQEISSSTYVEDGRRWLSVSVSDPGLFVPFHQLAVLATRLFESKGMTATRSLTRAVASWKQLLSGSPTLSDEAQLGLCGELAALQALIGTLGQGAAVAAWTACDDIVAGRHDFRFAGIELEVKSTRRRRRIHRIHGLAQLQASPGQRLFVLSLMFEQAGANEGKALPDRVAAIRALLCDVTAGRAEFEAKLLLALYRDEDAPRYAARLIHANVPQVIEIGGDFTGITEATLAATLGAASTNRIRAVDYDVDFEGLGHGPGSDRLHMIFKDAEID